LVTKHDAEANQPVVVTVFEAEEPVDEEMVEEAARVGRSRLERERGAASEAMTGASGAAEAASAPAMASPRPLVVVSRPSEDDLGRQRAERVLVRFAEARVIWDRKLARKALRQRALAVIDARGLRRAGEGA
jgi:hypothetical protein